MIGFALIDNQWEPIINKEWLEEIVAVELDNLLMVKRYIRRIEFITAVKKTNRHKPVYIKQILNNGIK